MSSSYLSKTLDEKFHSMTTCREINQKTQCSVLIMMTLISYYKEHPILYNGNFNLTFQTEKCGYSSRYPLRQEINSRFIQLWQLDLLSKIFNLNLWLSVVYIIFLIFVLSLLSSFRFLNSLLFFLIFFFFDRICLFETFITLLLLSHNHSQKNLPVLITLYI